MALPRPALAAVLIALLGAPSAGPLAAEPPPAPPERWVGLRVTDPDLRYAAVADARGSLMEVADAIPYLVIALDDEAAPVRAAVRERLLALGRECVDPLLDALEAARPGPKGSFGMLVGLGTQLTATDLAAAAGALSPVQPADRREAALVAALPRHAWDRPGEARHALAALRIASLLLADPDASVRRAAAGTLGLLGLLAIEARHDASGDGRTGPRLPLSPARRERLAELLHHGSDEIAVGAAGLAARFGDRGGPVGAALEALLEREAARDAAALALALLPPADSTRDALRKHRSYGCWRARLRLGDGEPVLAALSSKDVGERRLALRAALAEGRTEPAVFEALLPDLSQALEDGTYRKLEPRLRDLLASGDAGRAAEPLLRAFAEGGGGEPRARDLAAAAALSLAPATWARPRFGGLFSSPFPGDAEEALVAATVLPVLWGEAPVLHDEVPSVLRGGPAALRVLTLAGVPLGQRLLPFVGPGDAHRALHARWLAGMLDVPPEDRRAAWAAPGLASFTAQGARVATGFAVLSALLDASAGLEAPPPEVRALAEHVAASPDPWLRHLAARALRRLATK